MRLHILGCRGIPARHGGFETFAEQFSLYMVSRGHQVTVACQTELRKPEVADVWNGVRRVLYSEGPGPQGTIRFDLRSAIAASKDKGSVILTLGYNTAIFSVLHRMRSVRHLMNMDGVEWRRRKWSAPERIWLRANEWCGAQLANGLIADHPAIKQHLSNLASPEKITVIPYGADAVEAMPTAPVEEMGLLPGRYDLVIARPEPENSILEIVQAYSRRERPSALVILGRFDRLKNPYHARVFAAAKGAKIIFPGAIYDQEIVQSLRFHARAYVHGHQVGGTNPSLVESLAAGNAVIAHRNPYNAWVAGDQARFFSNAEELDAVVTLLDQDESLLQPMRVGSRLRHELCFRREMVMEAYENLMLDLPVSVPQWSFGYRASGRPQKEEIRPNARSPLVRPAPQAWPRRSDS
jgi:glycosyltransferase involved in cell wall biosynthesis